MPIHFQIWFDSIYSRAVSKPMKEDSDESRNTVETGFKDASYKVNSAAFRSHNSSIYTKFWACYNINPHIKSVSCGTDCNFVPGFYCIVPKVNLDLKSVSLEPVNIFCKDRVIESWFWPSSNIFFIAYIIYPNISSSCRSVGGPKILSIGILLPPTQLTLSSLLLHHVI